MGSVLMLCINVLLQVTGRTLKTATNGSDAGNKTYQARRCDKTELVTGIISCPIAH